MLTQPTFEKLYTMKLNGMADAFRQQQEDTDIASLSFEERFSLLVDQQWIWKENRALARRLASAKFKLSAAVEDIDFRHARGLDRRLLRHAQDRVNFYAIVSQEVEYDETIRRQQDAQRERREQNRLKRRARKLGYQVAPIQAG